MDISLRLDPSEQPPLPPPPTSAINENITTISIPVSWFWGQPARLLDQTRTLCIVRPKTSTKHQPFPQVRHCPSGQWMGWDECVQATLHWTWATVDLGGPKHTEV